MYDVTDSQRSHRFGTITGIQCEFGKQNSLEIEGEKKKKKKTSLFHEGEWHSKQQVRHNNEQKWRLRKLIISDTKIGNYHDDSWQNRRRKKGKSLKKDWPVHVQFEARCILVLLLSNKLEDAKQQEQNDKHLRKIAHKKT